jgi:tripartite-type tricarboxylate transporter receptor subunit TctC
VPTVAEQGYPGFDYTLWLGLWGPAGMPADITVRINKDVNAALARPDLREQLTRLGTEPGNLPQPEFTVFVRKEIDETQRILTAAGIKPQ